MDRATFLRIIGALTGGAALGTFPGDTKPGIGRPHAGGFRLMWRAPGGEWSDLTLRELSIEGRREVIEWGPSPMYGDDERGMLPELGRVSVTADVEGVAPGPMEGIVEWRAGSDEVGWYRFPGYVTDLSTDVTRMGVSSRLTIEPDGYVSREYT